MEFNKQWEARKVSLEEFDCEPVTRTNCGSVGGVDRWLLNKKKVEPGIFGPAIDFKRHCCPNRNGVNSDEEIGTPTWPLLRIKPRLRINRAMAENKKNEGEKKDGGETKDVGGTSVFARVQGGWKARNAAVYTIPSTSKREVWWSPHPP